MRLKSYLPVNALQQGPVHESGFVICVRSVSVIDPVKRVCLLLEVATHTCAYQEFWAAKLSPESMCRGPADWQALDGHCSAVGVTLIFRTGTILLHFLCFCCQADGQEDA